MLIFCSKGAVRTVSNDLKMCSQVWKYAELLNENNVKLMQEFVENECSKLDNGKYMFFILLYLLFKVI
jgi:hypothetical protein